MASAISQKMTKMTLNIPESLHRQIKATASLRGQSMRDFVVERLTNEEYDLEDINIAIAQGLHEVARYKRGEIKLQNIENVISELKTG